MKHAALTTIAILLVALNASAQTPVPLAGQQDNLVAPTTAVQNPNIGSVTQSEDMSSSNLKFKMTSVIYEDPCANQKVATDVVETTENGITTSNVKLSEKLCPITR